LKGDINFFSALDEANRSAKQWRQSPLLIPVTASVLLLILAGASLGFFFMGQKLERETNLLEQTIEEPLYAEEYHNVLNAANGLGFDISHNIQVASAVSFLNDQIKITSSYFHQIDDLAPGDVDIISYGVSENTIGLSCTTANNLPPAEFAQILDDSGLFGNVKYIGFSGSAEKYTFNIQCSFASDGEQQ